MSSALAALEDSGLTACTVCLVTVRLVIGEGNHYLCQGACGAQHLRGRAEVRSWVRRLGLRGSIYQNPVKHKEMSLKLKLKLKG
jgi:hypothetical protein